MPHTAAAIVWHFESHVVPFVGSHVSPIRESTQPSPHTDVAHALFLQTPVAERPDAFFGKVGPLHRPLLPAAALVGAIVVILADAMARAALPPAEIPLGLVTAVAGGPFFILLLARRLRT